ncbi:MAG: hypothetical protein KDD47_17140, partial [Acidobacteria bacterium]|nr:hypothetical protein [Acidobacteriota bacterium]
LDSELDLSLVDGGVLDNLGVGLLLAAGRRSRGEGELPVGNSPPNAQWLDEVLRTDRGKTPADWNLDVILVSDGGALLQTASIRPGRLESLSRVIDVLSAQTLQEPKNALDRSGLEHLLFGAGDYTLDPRAEIDGRRLLPGIESRDPALGCPLPLEALADPERLRHLADVGPADAELEAILAGPEAERFFTVMDERNLSSMPLLDGSQPSDPQAARLVDRGLGYWKELCADLRLGFEVFRRTPTLQDQFSRADAEAIYRLGRYTVVLKAEELKALLAAGKASRDSG